MSEGVRAAAAVMRGTLPLLIILVAAACEPRVPTARYEIVLTLPHDSTAYTQGLLYHDQALWESTGRYGESTVRKVDGRTGRVLMSRALPDTHFGEGLALAGTQLVQLTWKEGVAFVYDLDSLRVQRTMRYDGEGWGLCFDGTHFYMSNGSDTLYQRDRDTFAVLRTIPVRAEGRPLRYLNELECVGEHVYANVYQQDFVVQIEKSSGRVIRALDGLQLRLASRVPYSDDTVLNGIAHDTNTGLLFVTGKLWPHVFVIRVVEPG